MHNGILDPCFDAKFEVRSNSSSHGSLLCALIFHVEKEIKCKNKAGKFITETSYFYYEG